MTEPENDVQIFERWERSVEFRLFGDASDPTLTVPEQIATKVGDRVIAGQLQPGERIGEQELADEFKVSRGPVREAIRILEREGLVRVLARRGAVVTQLSARELHDLFEIRAGLFEIVVRKIAAQRPKELPDLADGGNAYAEMTYRLIVISARFSGNDRLQRMISALSLQTLRYSKLGLASVERRQRSVGLWQQSLQALEQGDTERLIALSHQRTQESGAEAVRLLQDEPPAP
jgi:DNA-binding GntR family transcriptional regulator